MIQLKEGDYRIKIVGKDTKGHINLSIGEKNKNIELSTKHWNSQLKLKYVNLS